MALEAAEANVPTEVRNSRVSNTVLAEADAAPWSVLPSAIDVPLAAASPDTDDDRVPTKGVNTLLRLFIVVVFRGSVFRRTVSLLRCSTRLRALVRCSRQLLSAG